MGAVGEKSVPFQRAECSRLRQELDARQTNKSEGLLAPSLSARRALSCVYVKEEKSKCCIRNHRSVWEPLLLLQKIRPFTPLLISSDRYRLSFWDGNPRVPLFRESRHIDQLPTRVDRPCVPEPVPQVISGASSRKEDLCIVFLRDLQMALAAR